jgi:hypothetical protein
MLQRKSSGTSDARFLRWLMAAHILKHKDLGDALLSQGEMLPHELGPQCGVGVLIRRRGDVLYLHGVLMVQL